MLFSKLTVSTKHKQFKMNCIFSRSDLASPSRGFIVKALTLQDGTFAVVLYFAALIVSLSNGALEDRIHLYELKPTLWNNTAVSITDPEILNACSSF